MDSGNGADARPKGGKVRLLSLDDLDARTRARRRADDLRDRVIAERGGVDRLDIMRLTHTSTWAVLSAMIEDQLARLLLGEQIEPSSVATLVNARRREGEVIGAPEPRDVTPSLHEYLAAKVAARPADSFSASEATKGAPDTKRTSESPNGSEGHSGGGAE